MIPIPPIVWTSYTATLRGRVLRLVLCEDCGTECVYVLEREGMGCGTSFYSLNEEGAEQQAKTGAVGLMFTPTRTEIAERYLDLIASQTRAAGVQRWQDAHRLLRTALTTSRGRSMWRRPLEGEHVAQIWLREVQGVHDSADRARIHPGSERNTVPPACEVAGGYRWRHRGMGYRRQCRDRRLRRPPALQAHFQLPESTHCHPRRRNAGPQ